MFFRVETSSDKLSSQNNGNKMAFRASNDKQTKTKKRRGINFILAHLKGPHYFAVRQSSEPII